MVGSRTILMTGKSSTTRLNIIIILKVVHDKLAAFSGHTKSLSKRVFPLWYVVFLGRGYNWACMAPGRTSEPWRVHNTLVSCTACNIVFTKMINLLSLVLPLFPPPPLPRGPHCPSVFFPMYIFCSVQNWTRGPEPAKQGLSHSAFTLSSRGIYWLRSICLLQSVYG